ncbi:MAG TPA: histidinol-phosphate transaminase, partial [Anaerolineales bacterium]|nr:histidinol-phosphate transaminase [Anaerolineales bacterium]
AFVFESGVNTITCRASFPMWHIATMAAGGDCIFVEPTANYSLDLPAMAARINANTRVVYICSPNNPTGSIVTQVQADDFMARVPERVVVAWDEAYCDYVDAPDYADSLRYVKDGRNALVVRSFSKSAGLANMRVGYAIGHTGLADYLRHARNRFHIGAASLAGAAASLDDVEYLANNRQMVLDGRAFLRAEFEKLGLNSLPSQANFVAIVDPPMPPEDLADTLLHRGFIVRAMEPFGLPNAVRVTVGTQAENEKFVAVLGDVISEA